jgi:hypothetical protein
MSQEPEAGLAPTFRSYGGCLWSHKLVHQIAGAKGGCRQDGTSSGLRERLEGLDDGGLRCVVARFGGWGAVTPVIVRLALTDPIFLART